MSNSQNTPENTEKSPGLEPLLRFPEFKKTGSWEKTRLIDTADKKIKWSFIGGPFGSNLKSSDYVENGVRVIQLQNIGDAEFFDDYKIFTSEKKANELLSNNIYPGDIILSKMGDPVGRACLIPNTHSRYVMCSDGIRLAVDEEKFNKYFVYSLINSVPFRSLVEKTATGSTRKRIGLDELKNLPMYMPTEKKEQQKIADCLFSLDELITAENQKLEAFKDHKKGLMQQLFPTEGQTTPQYRFPKFQSNKAWPIRQLGNICKFVRGPFGGALKKDIFVNEGYAVYEQSHAIYSNFNEFRYFITKDKYEELKRFSVESNDLIMSCSGTMGKFAVVPTQHKEGVINQALLKLSVKNDYDLNFIKYTLEHPINQEKLLSQSAGGAIKNVVGVAQLKEISLPIPAINEQSAIADCLSSIDELITAQTQKIESLKAHKKGLMQQLFPSSEANV